MSLDAQINFGNIVAGSTARPGAINPSFFYARWTGYLVPTLSGKYTIGVNCADGLNLFLGDTPLVNQLGTNLTAHSTLAYNASAVMELTAGVFYPLTLEWQHGLGTAHELQLCWTPPGGSIQVIPSANLSTSKASVTGNITGTWWNGTSGLWYPNGPGIIDFANSNNVNKNVSNVAGTLSDNLIKNGDFDQGLANWGTSNAWGGDISAVSVVNSSSFPRGAFALQATDINQSPESAEYIPIDITKTYFLEGWVSISAPLASGACYLGLEEYDGNKVAISHGGGSGALWALLNNATSTPGNTWAYFSAELSGSSATPTLSQFNSSAKFVRAQALLNWSTTAGQQKTIQVQGLRLSEVAAGHVRAIKLLQKGVSSDLNKQGSILPNQVVLITFTMPSFDVINATWAAQSLLHPDNTALSVPASSAVLGSNLLTDGDGESATVGSQAAGWIFDSNSGLLGASDFAHSGTKSLKIINGSAANSFSHQDVSVTNGRVYSLQGWIKTTALPTVTGAGGVLNVDAVSGVTGFTIISKTGTDFKSTEPDVGLPADGTAWDWTFVQCLFKPIGSGTIRLYLQLGYAVAGCSGSAWFDDVGIFPTGASWTGLSASTGYYLYSRIDALTGWIQFVNGNPPGTSPSDTLAAQCSLDGFISLPVKKVTTPASGSSGSDTGGGSGTCPEFDAPVFVRRYSQDGDLLFDGAIKAGEVQPGYESEDGTIKRGDFLKGRSFAQQADVYRAVQQTVHVPCAGWMRIDGVRFTACETIREGDEWLPAWKVPGAIQDSTVGIKVLIQVEADWDDEHNYYVVVAIGDAPGVRLIHNTPILPC
jgi:PA14 domain